MSNNSRPLTILLGLVLAACTSGTSVPPTYYDSGPKEAAADLPATPDTRAPDYWPPPDKGKPPDLGPTPDAGPCGNKQVDPGETCDKAIGAGKEGACPTLAECDDGNACTNDSLAGSAAACTAECVNSPVANCCGNGTVEGSEQCDDGNVVDLDGCSNLCKLPGGHLLLTEVAVSPTEAEFFEIYNPSSTTVALDNVYVADRNDYFLVTSGALPGASTDFVAQFPPGATIAAGSYLTVAVGGMNFKTAFGKAPDYELKETDTTVPNMLEPLTNSIGSQAGLTDGGELVILFTWDGTSDLVKDIDYVVWKGANATAVSKNTVICIDGPDADTTTSCYLDDTAVTAQSYLTPPQSGGSLHRCNYLEGTEKQSGGNGLLGHDETSEPLNAATPTWKRNPNTLKHRTPGGPAPAGFCPP
jgi:cysteine-rich repeat protein